MKSINGNGERELSSWVIELLCLSHCVTVVVDINLAGGGTMSCYRSTHARSGFEAFARIDSPGFIQIRILSLAM
jgi:hypothetical protein